MTIRSERGSEYREIIDRLRDLKETNSGDGKTPEPIPLIDPTANVTALIKTEVKRQDDLRLAEVKRTDDLRTQKEKHDGAVAELNEKLTNAESKRIDAIRAVDVAAVGVASDRAAQQAIVLANQVASSAETLRGLVATTAASVATSLQQVSSQLAERLTVLEKTQYETKGGVGTPPVWAAGLIESVSRLQQGRDVGVGRGEGYKAFLGWIVAGLLAATFFLSKFVLK